ncbi:hypothetical protein SFRURICE_020799 [Spodoptera frugiperda]|nr:hypothetical protein SFRURICE_020799 [Spodoptera frugiperda]
MLPMSRVKVKPDHSPRNGNSQPFHFWLCVDLYSAPTRRLRNLMLEVLFQFESEHSDRGIMYFGIDPPLTSFLENEISNKTGYIRIKLERRVVSKQWSGMQATCHSVLCRRCRLESAQAANLARSSQLQAYSLAPHAIETLVPVGRWPVVLCIGYRLSLKARVWHHLCPAQARLAQIYERFQHVPPDLANDVVPDKWLFASISIGYLF